MRGQKPVFFLMLFLFSVGSALVVRGPVHAWKYECCMCMACSHILCHYCMGESTHAATATNPNRKPLRQPHH